MMISLSSAEMKQLLLDQYVGRIACYNRSRVYVVPITYVYDGKYLYGHSREGLKIEMMRENPQVCFEVDEVDSITHWKSVVIQGVYQELIGASARQAMTLLIDKIMQNQTVAADSALSISHFHQHQQSALHSVIFRIQINEMTGRFEHH